MRRFLDALENLPNEPIASGLRMLLFTWLRCRAVYDLTWADGDEEARSIHLRQTKSGTSRRV